MKKPTTRPNKNAAGSRSETFGQPEEEVGLIDADSHAEGFRKARNARRTELAEDYVELIADFMDAHGEARQVDIARRLGVAQPTVVSAGAKLTRVAGINLTHL